MKNKINIPVILLILASLFCLFVTDAYRCATILSVANYTVQTDLSECVRIVQLSDLHGYTFGENNTELVTLVAEQKPDLILMTGDMIDKSDENPNVVCALIKQLADISPVYYGYGNHETAWEQHAKNSLKPALTEAGATVLELEYQELEVNGQLLRIGGYSGYYGYPGMLVAETEWNAHHHFFAEFEDTDRYSILLCHIPTPWLDWGNIYKIPVDLVLTGHYHGGQIRIPLADGIYAPYVGLFPEYTEGLYQGNTATCILSTGLGSSPGIPRINNLPQVVVVDLVPDNK